jgi:hypothetical protein
MLNGILIALKLQEIRMIKEKSISQKKAHDIFILPRELKRRQATQPLIAPLPLGLGVVPQPSQNSWRGAVIGLI